MGISLFLAARKCSRAPGTRKLPPERNSFPMAAVVFYAAIYFVICRFCSVRWLGAEADPLAHGVRIYNEFSSGMLASIIGQFGILYVAIRQSQTLFLLYSDTGFALLLHHYSH